MADGSSTADLGDYFERHYRPARPGLRPGTIAQYRNALSLWRQRQPATPIDAITSPMLAAFAAWMLHTARTPATANKTLRHISAILRHAADAGYLAAPPRWARIREPRRAPLAFTLEEFAPILTEAERTPGEICGLPAGLWWTALLRTAWYAGARISALLAVRQADVMLTQGGLYLRAETQKQHADQFLDLGPDALDALRAIWQPTRPLMFPWPYTLRTATEHFARICQRAGIPLASGPGTKFHRIRKSTASYLHRNGGDPTHRLGHSTPTVTARYFDPRICSESRQARFMPPPSPPTASL